MTRDEMIKLYCQISDEFCGSAEWCWSGISGPLEKFAALVAAHEREACAKVVEVNAMACNTGMLKQVLNANADAIRARGQG